MLSYIGRRFGSLMITMLIVSVILFVMMHQVPGGPSSPPACRTACPGDAPTHRHHPGGPPCGPHAPQPDGPDDPYHHETAATTSSPNHAPDDPAMPPPRPATRRSPPPAPPPAPPTQQPDPPATRTHPTAPRAPSGGPPQTARIPRPAEQLPGAAGRRDQEHGAGERVPSS